jgi:fumarate hydratase subunit alpha
MKPVREISCSDITETVKQLFTEAAFDLEEELCLAYERAVADEVTELGRSALKAIIENAGIARREKTPVCQDTGLAIVFVEIGQDVHIIGGDLYSAIEEGVRHAYREGYLRKSVCDPLSRKNTGDNTPPVIHPEIVPGDRIRLVALPKGGGSENVSSVTMLLPTIGSEGIKKHIIEKVREAGPNPCPPVIVGVGIGGSIDEAPILAKKALLRPLGEKNRADSRLAKLEEEILEEINNLGIGPQGYGGKTTALAAHIEMKPCHIASLPVAVSIQCHAARHKETVI